MKYTIEVDRDSCIACGVCYSTDVYHFEGDNDGKSKVINGSANSVSKGTFDDSSIDEAKRARDSCPVNAITIKE